MIFLRENGLIEDKITHDHIKRRLLGHWGSAFSLIRLGGRDDDDDSHGVC